MDNAMICKCCGGTVDRGSLRCNFCGVQYEITPSPLRIETFQNPVEHFSAKFVAPGEMFYKMEPEQMSEIAVHQLVKQLSKSIPICMQVSKKENMRDYTIEYRGDIRMVRPITNLIN